MHIGTDRARERLRHRRLRLPILHRLITTEVRTIRVGMAPGGDISTDRRLALDIMAGGVVGTATGDFDDSRAIEKL